MRKVLLFFIFFMAAFPCCRGEITVYFSPNGGCEKAVISEIRKASQTIDIAMYFLSSRDIARAVIKARDNNVRVRMVLDQGQEIESASKSGYLVKHAVDVRYHLGFGLMHNKFAIIDGKSLITGSFNWTRTAEERNEENLLVITGEKAAIEDFRRRFEYLWSTSRPDSRNAKGVQAVPAWFCGQFHVFCN
jgi:phosphatidylserine/phosphatidylglycerophosphate/cardiolipin synthase-like enzyme